MIFTELDLTNDVVKNFSRTKTEYMWSNGSGTLGVFYTSSTQISKDYYLDIYHLDPQTDPNNAKTQFSVVYGNVLGNNSHDGFDNIAISGAYNTAASNYVQYRNLFNLDNQRFQFAGSYSNDIYVINFYKNRLKQNIHIGNWNLLLSSGSNTLTLKDDSEVNTPTVTSGGKYYQIVSGSNSAYHLTGSNSDELEVYGHLYPEHGIMVFNGDKINPHLLIESGSLMQESFLKTISTGANFSIRNEQINNNTIYFIRCKNTDYNFSNNPSFTTGSVGDIKYSEMIGNPQTYITSIGLYNEYNELLACAKLSKPILKNYETETLLRIKLNF